MPVPKMENMKLNWRVPCKENGEVIGFVEEWKAIKPCNSTDIFGLEWYIIETKDGYRRETGNRLETAYTILRNAVSEVCDDRQKSTI